MNFPEFNKQVDRLRDVWGDRSFPDERVKLLWREVMGHDALWFTVICDGLIMSSERAPKVTDFSAAASEERERIWKIEKQKHERDAESFMRSSYADEDVGLLMKTIIGRMNRDIDDTKWKQFLDTMKSVSLSASQGGRPTCQICDGHGNIFLSNPEGIYFVDRCTCRRAS